MEFFPLQMVWPLKHSPSTPLAARPTPLGGKMETLLHGMTAEGCIRLANFMQISLIAEKGALNSYISDVETFMLCASHEIGGCIIRSL